MKPSTYGSLIKQKGFASFLGTQFLGALNDNLLKYVIVFLVLGGLLSGLHAQPEQDLNKINLLFILPSLLFTGIAGWLADNLDKRRVLVTTKAMEIGVMSLAWLALRSHNFNLQLGVLFLLATQFTFFGPSKYGIVPELVRDEDLSRANGLLEMSTFLAILLGSVFAGPLFQHFKDQLDIIAGILLAVAALGSLMSLGIGQGRQPQSRSPFRLSLAWSEVAAGVKVLRAERRLWLSNLGAAYFWFQGALFQLAVLLLGKKVLNLDETGTAQLGMALAVGIGAGSLLAGRWSGDKVELGLVPMGSLGMGLGALGLGLTARSHPGFIAVWLVLVGVSAGLFAVPLNALLQQKAEDGAKGRVQAAANFFSTLAIILAGAVLAGLGAMGLAADKIILVAGLLCFGVTAYLVTLLPEFIVRFTLWLVTHTVYKIRIEGLQNVPRKGPALIVCNHMSLADGLLVQACIQRFVRFMVYKPIYEAKPLHWLFKAGNAIPISAKRADAMAALEKAKAEIQAGHVVCIFAEGGITRTGNLLKFKKGLERIMDGVDAPIIPVHLDGLWGSIFSFRGGRFKWRRPERVPYPVTVTFGAPLPAETPAAKVREQVQQLSVDAFSLRLDRNGRLDERFVRTAKRHYFSFAMADSLGRELGYGRVLGASLALASWMKRAVKEDAVAVLLPPTVAGSLVNLAAAFAGKTTVNLNFTAGAAFMADACAQVGVKTTITSRGFLEKAGLAVPEGAVYVEDLFTPAVKAASLGWWALGLLPPTRLLLRLLKVPGGKPSDLATVIFSSGSTGVPKGVMLTHKNILANLESVAQVLQIVPKDRLIGALPFFHSLGYTGTIWLPLDCGFGMAYHPSPLDAGQIGKLAGRFKASILFSTPTFCQGYVRKVTPEQFAHLRYAIVGAEKLRTPLAEAFKERFKVPLLEGYGCTEMAPLVSINVPDAIDGGEHHVGHKPGTVGAPVPGVAAKVVDIESGEAVEPGASGLLLVKGPNQMAGYWGRPDLTAAATRDGWYVTGDVACIDEDGFIVLTDRLSRFSKIAGEMVPHLKVEDALVPALGPDAACVVCSVPDEAKGERLVVLHTDPALTPEAARAAIEAAGLPKLWVPKAESIFKIDAIPSLGTGKTDLRRARELAQSLSQSGTPA
jgi:acyl-[acyl-carrier-protein]-phospholipid O-acyltransferase/long-chain-fatty-acid--[acyl-carrier-protein] ligase